MSDFIKRFEGGIYLYFVIVIWVASALLVQTIFTSSETKFDKPLFVTYTSNSCFMLYLIPLLINWYKLNRNFRLEQKILEEEENYT